MKYHIPYGKTKLELNIDDSLNAKIIESNVSQLKEISACKTGTEIVEQALNNPINSDTLCNLAKDKKTATIIISDHTRPVPSKDIIPLMLKELRLKNPNIDVTLLVATGFHRLTNSHELRAKLGDEIFENEKIVVHDSRDTNSNVKVGTLPSGAPFVVNKLAVNCDLLISEGFVEPHFFAGFSGGRKSVLPGICDQTTVLANHNGKFINSEYARTGILDNNPIHADMVEAAKLVNLAFIVNVIIDSDKKTVAAFAGNYLDAHNHACKFLNKYASVSPGLFDIVITGNGGAPLDQNVYQCVKSCTAAESCVKDDGIIIECAECLDGHGGESFYENLKNCKTVFDLEAQAINTPIEKTKADQWEYQILCRIIKNHELIFVSRPEMENMISDMKMTYSNDVNKALKLAISKMQEKGIKNPSIGIIPDGVSIIINN